MKNILILVLITAIILFTSQIIADSDSIFLTRAKASIKNGIDKLAPEKINLSQPKLPKKLEKIYAQKNGQEMTEGEKIYAFSDVYIKKVPASVIKKHLIIPNASEKEWTYENVYEILLNYGDIENYKGREDVYKHTRIRPSKAIVRTAKEYNLPFPKTLDQLVYQLFDNISTNKTTAIETAAFARCLTYEYLDDTYVNVMTNRWNKEFVYDLKTGYGSLYRDMCSTTLGLYMGTPNTVSKLNCAIQKMVDAGKAGHEKPIHIINPDKYPVEAKEWLFYHPQPDIRRSLINAWFISKRPEKIEIVKVNLVNIKKTPNSSRLFWEGGKENKKALIREVEKFIEKYETARDRWLEDEMLLEFDDSVYTYDDLWQDYGKNKQKYIKRREGPPITHTAGGKWTKKVIKAKPAKEVEAERQRIKKWQKEGIDSCTFKGKI